ncbi:inorganic phosphate transporter PHO84 [Fusarium bulbicola]|nr:inorganic phosphate transporter PHO84 [Fusarium bulbicola]
MDPHPTHIESTSAKMSRRRCRFWIDYNEEVKHLVEIDYSTREREKQITKIVDDGGFKIRVFFVAASGFLASSYSLFSVDILSIALFYVYPPCDRLGQDPGLIIDELTLTGTILGMLLMGHLADRSGRKKWYGAELTILIVATIGMVQASEGYTAIKNTRSSMNIYSWIAWWRFLLGFGIGAEYPLSSIITAEWASTESRGVMLSAVFSMQSLGRLLSYTVSLGALRGSNPDDDEETRRLAIDRVWRWTVGVALIPAAIAILLRLTIPETPRFYAGIMKDPRKGVSNAMKLYGRNKSIQEVGGETDLSTDRTEEEQPWYTWYGKAWAYLTGPKKGWRPLFLISLLWAIMDVPWYGLTMDLSNTLATLVHDPSSPTGVMRHLRRASGDGVEGCGDDPWNKDFWNPNNTISNMIEQNALRSIFVVSIGSLAGSIGSILIIDFFRRKVILIATFLAITVLLAIAGGTLLGADASNPHYAAVVCYGILQFLFNLGPNTLIFVLAAEIFPTTYRGTFNGIAAASGKVGAVIIRVIIFAIRHGDKEKSLGIRLLALMPLMVLSAWLSWYLPDVQVVPKTKPVETVSERQTADGQNLPALSMLQTETPHSDAISLTSSDSRSFSDPSHGDSKRFHLLYIFSNMKNHDADLARDSAQLAALGHKQELERNFSFVSMLGLAFSILNSWTALASSLSVGLPSGGPTAVIWGLVTAGVGSVSLAVSNAEFLSCYPTSAGQYHWAAIISPPKWVAIVSWVTGWVNVSGWVALSASGGVLGGQLFLGIITMYDPNFAPTRWQYFLLFLLYTFLGFGITDDDKDRADLPASFVFGEFINSTGWPGGVAFLLGLLQGGLGLTGFDAVAHMIEEIPQPCIRGPRIMVACVAMGLVTGFAFLVCLLFVIKDVDAVVASPTGPLVEIYLQATNSKAGTVCLLLFPMICLVFGTLGIMATSTRILYAFARDGGLPFSRVFAKVDQRWGIPVNALLLTNAIVIIFGLVYLGSTSALNAILSAAVIALSISYAVTPAINCLQGRKGLLDNRPFVLPEWLGWTYNLVGIAYTIVITVFLLFPPVSDVTASNMNYAVVAFAAIIIVSSIQWFVDGRQNFKGPTFDEDALFVSGTEEASGTKIADDNDSKANKIDAEV